MKVYQFEFSQAEINQIEAHILRSQAEGVYYGDRTQYIRRDTRIMNELMKRRSSKQREAQP